MLGNSWRRCGLLDQLYLVSLQHPGNNRLELVFHHCWVCSRPPLCSAISRTRPQGGSNRWTAAVTEWRPHLHPAWAVTWTWHQHFKKNAFNSKTNSAVLLCIYCACGPQRSPHTWEYTHALFLCASAVDHMNGGYQIQQVADDSC